MERQAYRASVSQSKAEMKKAFSEFMMVALAYSAAILYERATERNPSIEDYKEAMADPRTKDIVDKLGKDYHTALSAYNEKDKKLFDGMINAIATKLGLSGTAAIIFLKDAYQAHDTGSSKSKRSSIRSLKAELTGKLPEDNIPEPGYFEKGEVISRRQFGGVVVEGELPEINLSPEMRGATIPVIDVADLKAQVYGDKTPVKGIPAASQKKVGTIQIETANAGYSGSQTPVPGTVSEPARANIDDILANPESMMPMDPQESVKELRQDIGAVAEKAEKGMPPQQYTPEQHVSGRGSRGKRLNERRKRSHSRDFIEDDGMPKPGFIRRALKFGLISALIGTIAYVGSVASYTYYDKSREVIDKLGPVGQAIKGSSEFFKEKFNLRE